VKSRATHCFKRDLVTCSHPLAEPALGLAQQSDTHKHTLTPPVIPKLNLGAPATVPVTPPPLTLTPPVIPKLNLGAPDAPPPVPKLDLSGAAAAAAAAAKAAAAARAAGEARKQGKKTAGEGGDVGADARRVGDQGVAATLGMGKQQQAKGACDVGSVDDCQNGGIDQHCAVVA
jgi:hypothetical protein